MECAEGDWWEELSSSRTEINRLDQEILILIMERMEVCRSVGETKLIIGKPIFDPEREKKVVEDRIRFSKKLGLDEGFVEEFINLLMKYSKKIQKLEIREADYQLSTKSINSNGGYEL